MNCYQQKSFELLYKKIPKSVRSKISNSLVNEFDNIYSELDEVYSKTPITLKYLVNVFN